MVQDPYFWKRFSTAVHQDDAHKEEIAGSPDLKHSYVPSPRASLSACTPMSPCSAPMSPSFPPSAMPSMSNLLAHPAPVALRQEEVWQREFDSEKAQILRSQSQQRPKNPKRAPSKLKKSASRSSTRPLLQTRTHTHSPSLTFSLRRPSLPGLRSPSCLSLSGRPKTMFKTWTTCEANTVHRASWLESQQKKSRHRSWMCWAFWIGMILLVAGVVTTLLVLRAHGII